MKGRICLIWFVTCTLQSVFVFADEMRWHHLEFPTTIVTNQTITSPPDGWIAGYKPSIHHITEVSVFEGHPSDRAELKPRNPGDKEVVWSSLQSIDAVWIALSYSHTCVIIQKQLPQKTTAVKVLYEQGRIETISYTLLSQTKDVEKAE